MNTKVCNSCNTEKSLDNFSPTSPYKGEPRWRGECKNCNQALQKMPAAKKAQKKYKSSEKYLSTRRKHREINRDKLLAQDRTPERRKVIAKSAMRRYYKDPLVNLKFRLRARFKNGLKAKNLEKQISVATLIGCPLPKFKEYIESKFQSGMSWDIPGSFHIDHIIPLDSATNEEEMYKLWHHSNLQPLYPSDNLKKSNKIS